MALTHGTLMIRGGQKGTVEDIYWAVAMSGHITCEWPCVDSSTVLN